MCRSTEVTWEGWTSIRACELHGVIEDEVALGLQLYCNTCLLKRCVAATRDSSQVLTKQVGKRMINLITPLSEPEVSSYCCATTSSAYWKSWEHWKIPCKLWCECTCSLCWCTDTMCLVLVLTRWHPHFSPLLWVDMGLFQPHHWSSTFLYIRWIGRADQV